VLDSASRPQARRQGLLILRRQDGFVAGGHSEHGRNHQISIPGETIMTKLFLEALNRTCWEYHESSFMRIFALMQKPENFVRLEKSRNRFPSFIY